MKVFYTWLSVAVALLSAGCSTDGAVFISDDEERAVGLEVDKQIRQEYQVCGPDLCDPQLLTWVEALGNQLAAKSDRPEVAYSFTVLHSDIINAFAAPGGFIYITTGLLRGAANSGEVAGVLGHEIGHIVERHGAEQMESNLGLTLLEQLVLGSDTAAADVARILYAGVENFHHSKSKELEADTQGVILTQRASISPVGIIGFFETLRSLFGDPDAISDILSSHPAPSERIDHANAVIADLGIDTSSLPLEFGTPYDTVLSWLPPPAGDAQ